jgi:hypothetical protein
MHDGSLRDQSAPLAASHTSLRPSCVVVVAGPLKGLCSRHSPIMGLIIPWNPQAVHGDMTDRPLHRVWGIILDGILRADSKQLAIVLL